MVGLVFKSAIIAATLALGSCATTPQCTTDADCISGFICGQSNFGGTTTNVCVALGTCNSKPDSQFPNSGPKCGDSIFCNVGSSCGEGYYQSGNDRVLTQVCVTPATGAKCAEPAS
jgi:hypothetical protein